MSAQVRIIDRDKGAKRLAEIIEKMADHKITIGIHADDGAKPHRRRRGRSAAKIIDVAQWAEFGTVREPARSWLRATIDANQGRISERIKQVAQQVLDGKIDTLDRGLYQIGLSVVRMIRRRFRQLTPNASSTLRVKKGSRPLVDTGDFAGAIGVRIDGNRIEAPQEGEDSDG